MVRRTGASETPEKGRAAVGPRRKSRFPGFAGRELQLGTRTKTHAGKRAHPIEMIAGISFDGVCAPSRQFGDTAWVPSIDQL